ncbi:MAG: hypothetical protein HZB30_07230 [Nitrospirae bacterium]|nr:hypothetical protein [Nitrospirota bacterium]
MLLSEIRALARKIEKIKEQQRQMGLFCDDRELLTCHSCDIEEDVTYEGFLIVVNCSNPGVDIGLRFSAVDKGKGRYRCPKCGEEVKVPELEM